MKVRIFRHVFPLSREDDGAYIDFNPEDDLGGLEFEDVIGSQINIVPFNQNKVELLHMVQLYSEGDKARMEQAQAGQAATLMELFGTDEDEPEEGPSNDVAPF